MPYKINIEVVVGPKGVAFVTQTSSAEAENEAEERFGYTLGKHIQWMLKTQEMLELIFGEPASGKKMTITEIEVRGVKTEDYAPPITAALEKIRRGEKPL